MAELKQFTREEIANSDKKDTKFVIHDKVYDVTLFLNEHPGGEEVLLDHGGKDASEDFDDVGHSTDAQELMKKYLIGEIVKEQRTNSKPKDGWIAGQSKSLEENSSPSSNNLPLVIGGIVAIFFAIWFFGLGA